jgi:queuosine precursor transporter
MAAKRANLKPLFEARQSGYVSDMTSTDQRRAASIPLSLFAFAIFYGGMLTIAGVLGAKQIALGTLPVLGPLAVEAGILPFLLLVAISSSVAELHGKDTANLMVRIGFAPLVGAILLTFVVLNLPTDEGMYEPAKEAFPIILGQSWRMMAAGIIAYGVSVTLNIWIFSRLATVTGRFAAIRGFIAAALSQIVDTLIFISVSFYGVRPIGELMIGQMIAKVVLSAVLVPLVIILCVGIGRWLDRGSVAPAAVDQA